jgi:hypothetical protein
MYMGPSLPDTTPQAQVFDFRYYTSPLEMQRDTLRRFAENNEKIRAIQSEIDQGDVNKFIKSLHWVKHDDC